MRQSRLIDLKAAMPTGAKVLRNQAERLSDGRSIDREEKRANRIMRQSGLTGRLNRQRGDRSVPPAWAPGPGQKSNSSGSSTVVQGTVVRYRSDSRRGASRRPRIFPATNWSDSRRRRHIENAVAYKHAKRWSVGHTRIEVCGIAGQLVMKTGNIGENLGQAPRQSRGGNAVETYNRRLSETMRKSDPCREAGIPAERTGASAEAESNNKWSFDLWGFNVRLEKAVTLANYVALETNGVFQFVKKVATC